MPFSNVSGFISGILHHFGEGYLPCRHTGNAFFGANVSGNAGTGRKATRHQSRSAGRADCGRGIHLLEAHASRGERIDMGRVNVCGAIAAEVNGALVIGVDDNDIWFVGCLEREGCQRG